MAGATRHSPVLSAEFALAAACCIWPPSARKTAAIRMRAGAKIDWRQFLRVVVRHRIFGQVHDAFDRAGVTVPPDIAEQIRTRATASARQNMQFAAESARLQRKFDFAGVRALFVKGVSLAELAYGSLGIKHSWDIDMLVAPHAVPRALELLTDAGYRAFPPLPPPGDRRYVRWLRYGCEYVFVHPTIGIHVELHWRLVDNVTLLSGISATSHTQSVAVAGNIELTTLTDQDLFAYLCVHGAMHGWSRIKWLADVAGLIAADDSKKLEERLEYARTLSADLCVIQAFLLCDSLFATPALQALAPILRRNWRNRWLERAALKVILTGDGGDEPDGKPFGILPIYATHFLLGRGVRFLAREMWNKLNGPYDLLFTTFPPWLGFLYVPMRLVSWLRRGGRIRSLPVSIGDGRASADDPPVRERHDLVA
jgi:hypothetical protein